MTSVRKYIFPLVVALACQAGWATPATVSAKLDSTDMMMGNVTMLHLQVVKDAEIPGHFPLLESLKSGSPYVTLLNDTVEIGRPKAIDTVKINQKRLQIDYTLPVQVFDSGFYRLPGFLYVSGSDTVISNSTTLKIHPVKVKADDMISPITSVEEPDSQSIFDSLPDWLVDWWWILVAIILTVALMIWGMKRYKTTGSLLPPRPETPPHLVALDRLAKLKSRKLWEDGREKEYYTILTDILRTYLYRRFGIQALEMTSRQIMTNLNNNPELRVKKPMMRQILDMADFVKFAKVRPLPDDNVKAFNNAVKFVEETAPKDSPEADKTDSETEKQNSEIIKKGGES